IDISHRPHLVARGDGPASPAGCVRGGGDGAPEARRAQVGQPVGARPVVGGVEELGPLGGGDLEAPDPVLVVDPASAKGRVVGAAVPFPGGIAGGADGDEVDAGGGVDVGGGRSGGGKTDKNWKGDRGHGGRLLALSPTLRLVGKERYHRKGLPQRDSR